jgi:DNA-binding winged helix-turn-helix (wHTH) protein/tetratricopeptide (TPR) repeat protein
MNNLRFGNYVVDPSLRQLRVGEQPIPLPTKAFDLLLFLASNPGRPLLKTELLSAIWPDSFVEESNLSHNVFLLRKALGPVEESVIVTLPGRGYQFAAKVEAEPGRALQAHAAVALGTAVLGTAALGTVLPDGSHAIAGASHSRLVYEEVTEERLAIWRSPLALAFVALGLAAVGLAGWLGWERYEDRVGGPPVQVIVTDLDGTTGNAVLDRTLKDILRFDLGQSPFVSVVPTSTIQTMLTQMRHGTTGALTLDIARDVCERTASQAVLHGSVARVGSGYVDTEDAVSCVDGTTLGTAREDADSDDRLPRAMDRIGATLRHELGESRRMIARFNKPLYHVQTGSLQALEDFSESVNLSHFGKFPEAIDLLKQAVALDPRFAAAYFNLAAFYSNMEEPDQARLYLQKAYDARDFATEPTRLTITAFYQSTVTGDLYEALRTYHAWVAIYPRNAGAWNGLSLVLGQLGQPAEAVDAAKHHIELLPDSVTAYQSLESAQMYNSDFAGARQTCDLALSRGFDGELIRERLLDLAYVTRDPAQIAIQERWAKDHPDAPTVLASQAAFMANSGRIRDAETLLDRSEEVFRSQGAASAGIRNHQGFADAYAEFGDVELAKTLLQRWPIAPDDYGTLLALAETGDATRAATLLQQQLALHPQSTLWNKRYAPLLEAEFAMLAGKPTEALAALEKTRSLDFQSADSFYMRGKAYMQARQWPQAEEQFRTLLTHPGVDVTAYQLPMAQLQLARVLVREGRRVDGAAAYREFLSLWSKADPDQPLLLEAKQELSAL